MVTAHFLRKWRKIRRLLRLSDAAGNIYADQIQWLVGWLDVTRKKWK